MQVATEERAPSLWRVYILCYMLYALLLVLTIGVVFVIGPATIKLVSAAWLIGRHWSIPRLVYSFGMLFLGLAGFIFVMGSEAYLRSGVERRQLTRRFARLAVPMAIAGGLGLLLQGISLLVIG